jgi:hypothetical protein
VPCHYGVVQVAVTSTNGLINCWTGNDGMLEADARKQAWAWRMCAVIDVRDHPGLLNENSNRTEISQHFHNIFDRCKSMMNKSLNRFNRMWGWDLLPISLPKARSSFCCLKLVPLEGILHGSNELRILRLHTIRAMFSGIDGFAAAWTPMYFRGNWARHTQASFKFFNTMLYIGRNFVGDR